MENCKEIMAKSEFFKIVDSKNYLISIPVKSHFSIGTSPYYAHQHGLAIDIYHKISIENYLAYSPVKGRVIKIKKQIAPTPKFHGGINRDFVLIIENLKDPDIVYKILHVHPKVQVGEVIKIGDPLGKTLRNGYFAPWSSPHIHLEVRTSKDPIRARGGLPFSLNYLNGEKKRSIKKSDTRSIEKIPMEIESVYPEFLLAYFPECLYYKINQYYGLKGNYNGSNCIIDGGIPQYKYGIVHLDEDQSIPNQMPIYIEDKKIGMLNKTVNRFGFLEFDSLKFLINSKEIKGISLFLGTFKPLVKFIFFKRNQFAFKKNSIKHLSIKANNPIN